MAIPYRDIDQLNDLGVAGYLKIQPLQKLSGYLGALFLINARGEPVEFTYNRMETPYNFLWRQNDIRRHATRKLIATIFSVCPKTPRLILCLAEEIGSELFAQDIQISIPVCRIAPAPTAISVSSPEIQEREETEALVNLSWYPEIPLNDSLEEKLIHELIKRGLFIEPFERALSGLRTVYPDECK